MIKQFDSYQRLASKTATYEDPDYLPLGLAEECGELVHEYARCKRKGVPMDTAALIGEIGDVLWMLSQICTENKLSLGRVATHNIAKLKKRDEQGTVHEKQDRIEEGGSVGSDTSNDSSWHSGRTDADEDEFRGSDSIRNLDFNAFTYNRL